METQLKDPTKAPTLELDSHPSPTPAAPAATVVVPDLVPSLDVTEATTTTAVVPSQQATMAMTETVKVPRPKHVTADADAAMHAAAATFVDAIRADPSNFGFADKILKLGDRANREMMPQVDLYKKKVAAIMKERESGSTVNKSLLQIKAELDKVNPNMVAKEKVTTKGFLGFMKKVRAMLPDEVLATVKARSETVSSVIDGLKQGLYRDAEGMTLNISDLEQIYTHMRKADFILAEEVYIAQLVLDELEKLIATATDLQPHERENIDSLRADATKQIMDLQARRAINQQFFLGSQSIARLTREQLKNIKSLMGTLEQSVLASLGLRAAAVQLQDSVGVTNIISNAIGENVAATGKAIRQSGEALTATRSTTNVNLEGLREGIREIEAHLEQQARANAEIIEKGKAVNAELTGMVGRLESRTGNATPGQLLGSKEVPQLAPGN